jgi:hypothetical protein
MSYSYDADSVPVGCSRKFFENPLQSNNICTSLICFLPQVVLVLTKLFANIISFSHNAFAERAFAINTHILLAQPYTVEHTMCPFVNNYWCIRAVPAKSTCKNTSCFAVLSADHISIPDPYYTVSLLKMLPFFSFF